MTPDAAEYAKLTEDDLCFELKRLRQRCEVLERDKRILEEEISIAQHGNHDKDKIAAYEASIATQSQQLSALRSVVTMQKQKFRVVKSHLALERKALSDILVELHGGLTDMKSNCECTLLLFKDKITALRAKDEDMSSALAASKEYITKLEIDAAHRGKELAQLRHDLSAAERAAESEQNALKEQIAAITDKIHQYQNEHATELCKMYADLEAKDAKYRDISSTNANLKSEVADITEQLSWAKQQLCERVTASSATITALSSEIAQLKQQLSEATKDNELLHSKLSSATEAQNAKSSHQDQLLQLHDKLMKDFHVVLEREKRLQNELAERNIDKNDIATKLRSIQDKVANMEEEHESAMAELRKELFNEQNRAKNLSSDVSALNESMIAVKQQTEEWKQKYTAKEKEYAALKQQSEYQTNAILKAATEAKKLQEQIDDKQKYILAKETMEQENSSLQRHVSDLMRQLADETAAKEEYICKLRQIDPNELAAANSKITTLEQLLQSKDETIDHLKETIRRECEERTEMMIEISELKDRIKRLKTKSTADSTTTTVSPATESVTKFPSLKSVVPESAPETVTAKKGVLDDANEDTKWSQRVNAYSGKNRSKPKR